MYILWGGGGICICILYVVFVYVYFMIFQYNQNLCVVTWTLYFNWKEKTDFSTHSNRLSSHLATVTSNEVESRTLPLVKLPSRIINGEEATPYEFPHQAALLRQSGGSLYHTCGASVIAQDWVVTAAHCVDGV